MFLTFARSDIHRIYIVGIAIISLSLLAVYYRNPMLNSLHEYTIAKTEAMFGSKHVAPHHEAMISDIAKQMGVTHPILMRKMSSTALQSYGYYNAIAYYPLLFNIIPICNQPYIFISEGFFEDLTLEEQRFVIGHEMVHIKEQHTRYIELVIKLCTLFVLVALYYLRKYLLQFLNYSLTNNFLIVFNSGFAILFFVSLVGIGLIKLAYLRHIETIADKQSIEMLHTAQGGIKLMDRWVADFNMPLHNESFDLFADHPSVHQRKTYCSHIQTTTKDI